jgi:aminoglycoside phosphotransferase (APT) family kinase protein
MARTVSQEELDAAERFGQFVPVYKIDEMTVVKSSKSTRLSEAATMRFIRENTQIPVPKVYNAYKDETSGHTRIIMEFIEGEELEGVWDDLDDAEKKSVINQLQKYMEELRGFKSDTIGTVDGSWCDDHFFDYDRGGCGPFNGEAEFNAGITKALKNEGSFAHVDLTCDIWQEIMTGHQIVLTHNDFAPRNILVRGSEVVAILDWELSGYYPEYWEYCKALRRPDWESAWIREKNLEKILKPWHKELSVMWNTNEIIW